MDKDFLDQAEKEIVALLRSTRPELMEAFGSVHFTEKEDKTVVTHLDKQLEEQLSELFRKLDPGIGIEGEELGKSGSRETYWLIDPIDGTEQFIRGISSPRTQLCLIDNGKVVWSLMDYFARDELFLARPGKGATSNGRKIQMAYRPLNRAWIEIGVNLFDDEFLPRLLELRKHIAGFSMARDPSLIFSGKIDGLIGFNGDVGGGPWDYAPRSLFYEEAGGKITNFDSQSYDFTNKNYLVAHPKNFDILMDLVK